jgi:anti-sigma factor RsiW
MKQCWPEGELRAFLDGELAPEQMAGLSAHLKECSECEGRRRELAGRAARVSVLMGGLGVETPRVATMPVPRPRPAIRWRRWAGLAAVVAAGFVIGLVTLPKSQAPGGPPARIALGPAVAPPVEAVAPDTSAPAPVRLAVSGSGKRPAPLAKTSVTMDGFIALDNEPFEAGLLVRMALGVDQIPADVVFSADGRARAYRLVNEKSK